MAGFAAMPPGRGESVGHGRVWAPATPADTTAKLVNVMMRER